MSTSIQWLARVAVAGWVAVAARPSFADDAAMTGAVPAGYVGILGSYVDAADRRDADYKGGGTILAGIRLNQQISAEVKAFGAVLDRAGDRNTPFIAGVGGDLRAMERHGLFVSGGAGVEYGSADRSHRASPYLEVGAGYEHHLLPRMSLRLETSYRLLTNLGNNGGNNDGGFGGELWASAGLVFDVARRHVDQATEPAVAVVPVRCPAPPAGFSVDADGLLTTQDSRDAAIGFATNSAKLDAPSEAVIAELALALRCSSAQQLAVQVIGHADVRGGDVYNVKLSDRRAEAVRDALIADGLQPERVSIVGEGKYEPLVKGNDPKIHQANRRIEIKLYVGVKPE